MKAIQLSDFYHEIFMIKEKIPLNIIINYFDKFPFKIKVCKVGGDDLNNFFVDIYPFIQKDNLLYEEFPPLLNIWEGTFLGYDELKHCAFLAWLFNPGGNHHQKGLFLSCFLDLMGLHELTKIAKNGLFNVTTESYYEDYGRVDILIYCSDFLFLIEAKTQSHEGEMQLSRYNGVVSILKKSLNIPNDNCKIIFLTPDGRVPVSGKADYNISWERITQVCQKFSEICKNGFLKELVIQYRNFLIKKF